MLKRMLTIGLVSAALISPALAQEQQLREPRQKRLQKAQVQRQRKPNAGVRKFQKALNLTDAQTEQLRSLLTAREQEMQRLRGEGKGKGRKADLKTAREKFQSDLRGILTPEQTETFDQRFSGKKK
jgi:hypothetical protein